MISKLTDESKKLRQDILKLAHTLGMHITQDDQQSHFPKADWDKCADFGIMALPFPEEYGGLNSSMSDLALAIETLGQGCADRGLIFSLCAHLFACCIPLWKFGDDRLKNELLPSLIRGKLIAANAMTEPESGSDAFNLKTTAEKTANGYVINGSKIYSTNAPVCDILICYAKTSAKLGCLGITAFAIPKDTPGVKLGTDFKKIGLRTSPMGAVYFDNCLVSDQYRIGNEGNGARMFEISMNWERIFLFAFYVGMMERQFQACLAYAQQRKQFDQPIFSFQAVSHKLVDMKLRLEVSKLLLYQAVHSLENGADDTVIASCLAKLYIAEAAVKSGLDAVQIHGGFGTIAEGEIERMLRDAIPATIFSGTN